LATGCRRQVLNDERTVKLDPAAVQSFPIDAPIRDEQVKVKVSSPGAPVNVYVVLQKDQTAAEDALEVGKAPASSLGGKDKVEDATLDATVPAKSPFAVVLGNTSAKTAQVKMTITGR